MILMAKKSTYIYLFFGALLFFTLNLIPLLIHRHTYFAPDSIGYYGIAATLCGFDWEDTLSTVNTYSYGYSLLLVPIIALFHKTTYILAATALLNSMLLSCIFVCSFLFIKKFVASTKIQFLAAVGLTAYSGYLSAARNYFSDLLIICLFSVLIVLWCNLLDSPKYYKNCFVALVAVYMYATHQRAIIIPIVLLISYIILCGKKVLNYKHLLTYLLTMAILFIIARCVYSAINPIFAAGLEINANDEKVRLMWYLEDIFSLEQSIRIFRNLLGQFYYLYVATLGLFPIGMCVCVDLCLDLLRDKHIEENKQKTLLAGVSLVLILTFVLQEGMVCISINPTHTYHLVMGRYIEYMVMPVVAILLIIIKDHKDRLEIKIKEKIMKITLFLFIAILCAVLGGISITFWEKELQNASWEWGAISAIGVSWLGDYNIPWLIGLGGCIALSIYIIWSLLDGRTTRTLMVWATVLSYSLCNTTCAYIKGVYPIWQEEDNDIGNIAGLSNLYEIETFYWPTGTHALLKQQLQVMMPNTVFSSYSIEDVSAIVETMPESCMIAIPNAFYSGEPIKDTILKFSVFKEFTLLVNIEE